MKEDSVAQRIIATSVTEPVLLHIISCPSSKQMGDNLCAVYENKTDTSVHMLQRQWFSFVKDPADDMATHVSKIQDICHRLKALGEDITDNMMMTKILMTLPSCYDHFATAWESTALDQRTLSNLTSRLIMEEARKNSQDKQVNGALVAQARSAVRGKKDPVKNKKKRKTSCMIDL
ncbi:copia protein [Lasius niger]|uniref:Copia protein n=1 Tax=Lasius niger TaxID=67767 RepID=A0A0J7K538_LASNI|nr:copia protein [Lasius niger]